MDLSFYELGNIYKKNVLLNENQSLETMNSMQSFTQPGGSSPIAGNGSNVGVNDSQIEMPAFDELTISQKKSLLVKFLKDEINSSEDEEDDSWDSKIMEEFKTLYGLLLDGSDEDDDDYEDLVSVPPEDSLNK